MPTESSGRRGSLREEQKRLTRARIVDTARSLFETQGYSDVRVDDIVAAVGCSRATFYLHFTSKGEVLRAIANEGTLTSVREFYADLDRVLTTGSREAFAEWMTRAIYWFLTNKDMLPAWDEATALEPEFRAVAREGIMTLADSMPAYLARWPEPRRDEARLRIELLVAQLERFFTRWAMQGTIEVTAEKAAAVLTDVWYPALQAPAGD
ncbi:TetR/AcrR family transcriptional regulator [Nocardia asteroides]|uniref:Putative TetR family transcriptional regulator n=1 Tax=Nocardia asteroides NBRC 15531 TaxID=1110697 RepID=U5EKD5_NOCAS|nr:TetR/AcrR family transcriptional regulator [Nocardia asteroides]TLF70273.1 TetR/AcrR family transcriptional regulator [Nocardia asteroides NBRC 15531]UGT49801.1 TetR/AcrR family transcriptional regulator [Nocardia asteroides]SFM01629.1 transcriptional regulator, TetR family [Nocardia asteroides]VEG37450.1 HTH-type transcriptional regulator EthR [Nocardia asteroides]BAO98974.1 putative TetR family transcriptional regulator [Nocardia asteroides NBRC 15531]